MTALRLLAVPLLAISVCGLGKSEAKVCKHVGELMESKTGKSMSDDDLKECEAKLEAEMASCDKKDEALDCYMGVDDIADLKACEKLCKSSSGSSGSSTRSASKSKSSSAGGDCPNGSSCLNRCKSTCEAKHGKMVDIAKMGACARAKKPADVCVDQATNQSTRRCFLTCRGLKP